MRGRRLVLAAGLLLAACGVDGAPEPPEPRAGISLSGEVRFGLARGG